MLPSPDRRLATDRARTPAPVRSLVQPYERVPWDDFINNRFTWGQGQHMVVVAPTGQGKSTIIGRILRDKPVRKNIVMFGTKTYDETYEREYLRRGFKRITEWPPPPYLHKVLLWPYPSQDGIRATINIQRRTFRKALDKIFLEKGWAVLVDEEHWMCNELGLKTEIATLHHQGRSSGLTNIDGIQRPAWVPVITYGSASHALLAKTTEVSDWQRLSSFAGTQKRRFWENLQRLDDYEYIYVATRGNHEPIITKVDF